MASIILSFVGNQDPVSDNTGEEGSIVTLVRHLLQEQNTTIKHILLLHTQETQDRAELTKGWLEDEPIKLPGDRIQLIPVSPALSLDPVNLLLAVNEARKGIATGLQYFSDGDQLEFNCSSGTPVMKSAWSALQAAGYVPHSSVWQIRNPHKKQPGQSHVFATNVDTLKREFDIKVIKRQIQDYNYSGALVTLQESNLELGILEGLLNYAQCRISFDFDRAHTYIKPLTGFIDSKWITQISNLRQKNQNALIQEIYWNALIKLNNQNYSEFLIFISAFQERFLWILVDDKLKIEKLPTNGNEAYKFWQESVIPFDSGGLSEYLDNYRKDNGYLLKPNKKQVPDRPVLKAIVSYFPDFKTFYDLLSKLNKACKYRNSFVHHFEGVSEIKDLDTILATLRKLLKETQNFSKDNPFDLLNQEIFKLLDDFLRPLT
jgi:hypothetical protein